MLTRILNILFFVIIVFIELLILGSGMWWLIYLNLFIIVGTFKLAKNDIFVGLLFILLGTVIVDFLAYRQVGQQALFFATSLLLVTVISRFFRVIGNQSSSLRMFIIFVIFLIIQGSYVYYLNILTITQIIWMAVSNILVVGGLLIIASIQQKSNNAFKV